MRSRRDGGHEKAPYPRWSNVGGLRIHPSESAPPGRAAVLLAPARRAPGGFGADVGFGVSSLKRSPEVGERPENEQIEAQ